jgi:hypothetical protein
MIVYTGTCGHSASPSAPKNALSLGIDSGQNRRGDDADKMGISLGLAEEFAYRLGPVMT